ncbi:MAG: MTH938/NDUFAF3 family protein [Candidatus Zhuqueibacterota bacterium]
MIEQYQFGKLRVNGICYTADLIIVGAQVLPNWRRQTGHRLGVVDIAPAVLEFKPSIVVIGTGAWGRLRVLPETKRYLADLNIDFVIQRTGRAWKSFNSLLKSGLPMAAFHLTC